MAIEIRLDAETAMDVLAALDELDELGGAGEDWYKNKDEGDEDRLANEAARAATAHCACASRRP